MVIGGAAQEEPARWSEAAVRQAMSEQLAQGLRRKEAAERVAAQSGWRKREVYDLALDEE